MYSDITIVEVVTNVLPISTHDQFNNFALKYGISDILEYGSIPTKKHNLAKYLVNNKNIQGITCDSLTDEIITDVINDRLMECKKFNEFAYPKEELFPSSNRLEKYLLKDGYKITNYELIRIVPSEIDLSKEENSLINLLEKHKFNTAIGHYKIAQNNFYDAQWAGCNAQLRSYVECLFRDMVTKIKKTPITDTNAAIQFLSKGDVGILKRDLNEFSDDGKNFIQGFWKRLHPEGSHPGLSDEYDSVFRFNLVIITTMELLRRFDDCFNF